MSNRNKHISYTAAAGWMDISVPPDMEAEFKKMVQRATSTWQDMSPEMRDFADRVLGVESIMGQNMKEGHSSNTRSFKYLGVTIKEDNTLELNEIKIVEAYHKYATRSCCNTLLREPHHNQCKELDKIKSVLHTQV